VGSKKENLFSKAKNFEVLSKKKKIEPDRGWPQQVATRQIQWSGGQPPLFLKRN
jgi:hypothetical protein